MNQKRYVRMFKPEFADKVKDGRKKQTIRKTPKRMPRIGEIIDCRRWVSKPYRSKQIPICEGIITAVELIAISKEGGVAVNGKLLPRSNADSLASKDGFSGVEEMVEWFEQNGELPFEGILIKWDEEGFPDDGSPFLSELGKLMEQHAAHFCFSYCKKIGGFTFKILINDDEEIYSESNCSDLTINPHSIRNQNAKS